MSKLEFVPWLSIPQNDWYNRVSKQNASEWYHQLDFLKALIPHGGMLSDQQGDVFIPWPVAYKYKIIRTVQQPLWIQRFNLLYSNNQIDRLIILDKLFKSNFSFELSLFGQFDSPDARLMRNRVLGTSENGSFLRDYNSQTKRNLKAALPLAPVLEECLLEVAVKEYFIQVGSKLGIQYKHWNKLYNAIIESPALKIMAYKLVSEKTGHPLAYLVMLKDRTRIYNVLPSTTEKGKPVMAMTTLIHEVLNLFDGMGLIFDFEGSMHPGIDRFYSGFGATIETYTRFSQKNLF